MIKIKQYSNGFSWPIILIDKGWIYGEIKMISIKRRVRVVRKIFLISKRNKRMEEIFVEYYSPRDFMIILDNAYKIISYYLDKKHPIDIVYRDIESLISSLNLFRKYLEEIDYGGR